MERRNRITFQWETGARAKRGGKRIGEISDEHERLPDEIS